MKNFSKNGSLSILSNGSYSYYFIFFFYTLCSNLWKLRNLSKIMDIREHSVRQHITPADHTYANFVVTV